MAVQATALWYNMREEVVVYIDGQPFVLREDERPFKNMQVRWLACSRHHILDVSALPAQATSW